MTETDWKLLVCAVMIWWINVVVFLHTHGAEFEKWMISNLP